MNDTEVTSSCSVADFHDEMGSVTGIAPRELNVAIIHYLSQGGWWRRRAEQNRADRAGPLVAKERSDLQKVDCRRWLQ